jgi:hypothetical protein
MLKYLISLLLLISCGTEHESNHADVSVLADKVSRYKVLIQEQQDRNGFIHVDKCDSLLYSGLIGASGIDVDLRSAEGRDGEWFRRPIQYNECYSAGESRSTISRDGLLGVIWYGYINNDLKMLEDLYEFGERRDWFMGDDTVLGGHTYFTPLYRTILAKAIAKLGGERHYWASVPLFMTKCEPGYRCHLQVLQILLIGEIQGSISGDQLNLLRSICLENHNNPLFTMAYAKYTNGDYSRTIDLLSKAKYPTHSLPTSAEVCSEWSIQRIDTHKDQLPCPAEGNIHSGGDLIFIYEMMNR